MKKNTIEYLSENEVAKLLNLPEVTIQRWIHQGKIHAYGKPSDVISEYKKFSENKQD